MGDVLTLIEKAQEDFDAKKAAEVAEKLKKNSFDLNDLLDQMQQIHKMGSLGSIVNMLPGLGGKVKEEDLDRGQDQMRQMESIILSMTKAERAKPSIINPSRKRRIAAGSGTKVEDVNRVLRQFEQMQKMFKMFGGGKKGKRRHDAWTSWNALLNKIVYYRNASVNITQTYQEVT